MNEKYVLSFKYNAIVKEAIKKILGRQYQEISKTWSIPISQKNESINQIRSAGYTINFC